jgi:sugar phosphate isomerase/epimerase
VNSLPELFELAMELGYCNFEIGVSRLPFNLAEILKAKEKLGFKIVSAHNVATERPLDVKNQRGDFISSPDEATRAVGVVCLRDTIENCRRLGGKAVVIHAGYIKGTKFQEMLEQQAALGKQILENGFDGEAKKQSQEIKKWRSREAGPYLEAAIRSLGEAAASAKKILLGLESRYFYNEIPDIDELSILFDRLKNGVFGFWHDVGHAQMSEILGFGRHEEWLERYGERLIGAHLHDMTGTSDHQSIGKGNIDFEMVAKYLKPDTIRVLELNPAVPAEEVADSLKRLEDLGIA